MALTVQTIFLCYGWTIFLLDFNKTIIIKCGRTYQLITKYSMKSITFSGKLYIIMSLVLHIFGAHENYLRTGNTFYWTAVILKAEHTDITSCLFQTAGATFVFKSYKRKISTKSTEKVQRITFKITGNGKICTLNYNIVSISLFI